MANPFSRKAKPAPKRRTHHSASSAEVSTSSAASTRATTIFVVLVYAGAAIVSAFGLYAAGLLLLPWYVAWAVILMIDAGIVVYKIVEIKLRNDPRKMHLAIRAKAGNIIASSVSSLANLLHVLTLYDVNQLRSIPDWASFILASIVGGASPWFAFLAGSVLVDILVKPKPKKVEKTAAPEPAKVPAQRTRKPKPVYPVQTLGEELQITPEASVAAGFEQPGKVVPPPEFRVGDGFLSAPPLTPAIAEARVLGEPTKPEGWSVSKSWDEIEREAGRGSE